MLRAELSAPPVYQTDREQGTRSLPNCESGNLTNYHQRVAANYTTTKPKSRSGYQPDRLNFLANHLTFAVDMLQ